MFQSILAALRDFWNRDRAPPDTPPPTSFIPPGTLDDDRIFYYQVKTRARLNEVCNIKPSGNCVALHMVEVNGKPWVLEIGFGFEENAFLIDLQAPDLNGEAMGVRKEKVKPLLDLLENKNVTKIMHQPQSAIERFYEHYDVEIKGVYSTQLASDYLGEGTNFPIGALLQHYCKTKLDNLQKAKWWRKNLRGARIIIPDNISHKETAIEELKNLRKIVQNLFLVRRIQQEKTIFHLLERDMRSYRPQRKQTEGVYMVDTDVSEPIEVPDEPNVESGWLNIVMVQDRETLKHVCENAHPNAKFVAVDLEFFENREPCLVQLCFGTKDCYLINLQAEGLFSLSKTWRREKVQPLLDLFENEELVKIIHCPSADFHVIWRTFQVDVKNTFCTQKACSAARFDMQCGLLKAVYKFTGEGNDDEVVIDKSEQQTDWLEACRRESGLSESEKLYAACDVRFLHLVADAQLLKIAGMRNNALFHSIMEDMRYLRLTNFYRRDLRSAAERTFRLRGEPGFAIQQNPVPNEEDPAGNQSDEIPEGTNMAASSPASRRPKRGRETENEDVVGEHKMTLRTRTAQKQSKVLKAKRRRNR